MKKWVSYFIPQPLAALIICAVAASLLSRDGLQLWQRTTGSAWLSLLPLALGLTLALFLAGLYPIHIQYRTKINLTTPLLYLIVILLPPGLAGLCAALGTLLTQLLTARKRGNLPSDVVIAVGRWTLMVWVGNNVAYAISIRPTDEGWVLLGVAILMFLFDVVSASLEFSLVTREPPWAFVKSLLHEGGVLEIVQYLLGVLGALAAEQKIWSLLLLALPVWVVYLAFKNAKETRDSTRQLLESMADAVDLRDPFTGGHSRRVTEYTGCILRALNIIGPEAQLVIAAARVHDIGKIGIPDSILNNTSKLTPDEWRVMQSHAQLGADLLARYHDFARGVAIVRHHHERWDGQGYPDKLKAFAIPFGARVIAVADSFDAMTSDRPYRKGMSVEQALSILLEGRGTQWDVTMVDALVRHLTAQKATQIAPQPQTAPALG